MLHEGPCTLQVFGMKGGAAGGGYAQVVPMVTRVFVLCVLSYVVRAYLR